MISLFIDSGCNTCKKAKVWLQQNNVSFEERDIYKEPLSKDELSMIFDLAADCGENVIALRSLVFSKLSIDFDHQSLDDLLVLITKQPNLLRLPIIVDDHNLMIGFNENNLHNLLPSAV